MQPAEAWQQITHCACSDASGVQLPAQDRSITQPAMLLLLLLLQATD
jgi:hypothetical protein